MTKRDLIEDLVREFPHFSKRDAEVMVKTVLDCLTEALCRGDRIEIRGFGSFSVKQREGRLGRNPRTGAAVALGPRRVPFFKAAKELRERVDRGGPRRGEG